MTTGAPARVPAEGAQSCRSAISDPGQSGTRWERGIAESVRLFIAPVILLFSGFFTADFLLSEQYTWPRTSRVVVLTLTLLVLSYEFVYKEQRAQPPAAGRRGLYALLYSCAIPYTLGVLALLALAHLAS